MSTSTVIHPNALKNTRLDFFTRMKSSPAAWEKVCKIGILAINTFAQNTSITFLVKFKAAAELTVSTINMTQFANPVAYFLLGKYKQPENGASNHIFYGAHLYLSSLDVTNWVCQNAKGIAQLARTLGTNYPLVGRVCSVNLSQCVLPAALVLFTAHLYNGYNDLKAAATPEEITKARLQTAWSVGQIALTLFALSSISNPAVATGFVAVEFATHLVGLVGDGYGIYNP